LLQSSGATIVDLVEARRGPAPEPNRAGTNTQSPPTQNGQ
jgi:hypothetical protein